MTLFVFSTHRALLEFAKGADSAFLPPCKTISEFFENVVIYENIALKSKEFRTLFLWRAIKNIEIHNLGFEKSFVQFLERSNFIFRFFDELDSANVKISDIDINDTYGDYSDHLRLLERIYEAYKSELKKYNLDDSDYQINTRFLQAYKKIEIFIDGILSTKEMRLLEKIAESSDITLFFTTSPYNLNLLQKMLSKNLTKNTRYAFHISTGKLDELGALQAQTQQINLYKFDLRVNQALLVLAKVNEWLKDGVENIAVILPDENFAKYLQVFDSARNLNYAMGFADTKLAQKIQNLCEKSPQEILALSELNIEINALRGILENLSSDELIAFLLKNITNLDDNNGGKVRVMGILESRSMSFERAIIVDFNSDFIPILQDNDMFLNTAIRKRLNLPTLRDKENLQRHYYFMLIQNTKIVEIACVKGVPVASLLNDLSEVCKVNEIDGDKQWRFYPPQGKKAYIDDEIITRNTKKSLSASALKVFLDCKRKFYFQYLCENLRPDEEKDEFLGTKIHNLLCEMGQNFDVNKIRKSAESSAQGERLDLEITLKKLASFFKQQVQALKNGTQILHIEQSKEFEFGGFDFVCKIDRVDKIGDKIRIIDYKLKKDFSVKKDGFLQLLIYKMALQGEILGAENAQTPLKIECLYFDLLNNKEIIMDEVAELEAREMLDSALSELKGEINFARCEDINACKFCDYVYLCERY